MLLIMYIVSANFSMPSRVLYIYLEPPRVLRCAHMGGVTLTFFHLSRQARQRIMQTNSYTMKTGMTNKPPLVKFFSKLQLILQTPKMAHRKHQLPLSICFLDSLWKSTSVVLSSWFPSCQVSASKLPFLSSKRKLMPQEPEFSNVVNEYVCNSILLWIPLTPKTFSLSASRTSWYFRLICLIWFSFVSFWRFCGYLVVYKDTRLWNWLPSCINIEMQYLNTFLYSRTHFKVLGLIRWNCNSRILFTIQVMQNPVLKRKQTQTRTSSK